jgi:hypothetical protein
VKLVVYFDRLPSSAVAQAVVDLYDDLPRAVKSCFAAFEMRHANLQLDLGDHASLMANSTTASMALEQLAISERDMFSKLFSNEIGLDSPSHILLLTPDTIPVQANWLNLMDYQSRVPIERFWIKGSLFRGTTTFQRDVRDLPSMSRVALYNIGDDSFGKFYSEIVRPYVAEYLLPRENRLKPIESDWTNYFFRGEHYDWSRSMASLFRATEAIQDLSGCPVDLAKIQHDSPDTLIVKGIAPDLQ